MDNYGPKNIDVVNIWRRTEHPLKNILATDPFDPSAP